MTRIEYFNTELTKNLGYEYDMELIGQMSDGEKCEVFNILPEDIAEYLPQLIFDYYATC